MRCCELNAGLLIHRVTIQREEQTPDLRGGNVTSWEDFATLWARVMPVSGGERFAKDRIEASRTHKIYTRFRDDFTTADRILYKNKPLQIRSIINLEERNLWLEISADEGVGT